MEDNHRALPKTIFLTLSPFFNQEENVINMKPQSLDL